MIIVKIEDLAEEYVTKMSHRNEKRVLKNPLERYEQSGTSRALRAER